MCGDDEIALDAAFRGGAGDPGDWRDGVGGAGAGAPMGPGFQPAAGGRLGACGCGDEGSGLLDRGGRRYARRFAATTTAPRRGCWRRSGWPGGRGDMGEVIGMANARPGPDFAALTRAVLAVRGCRRRHRGEAADQGRQRAGQAGSHGVAEDGPAAARDQCQARYTGSVVERIGRVNARHEGAGCGGVPVGLTVVDGAVNALEGARSGERARRWFCRGDVR